MIPNALGSPLRAIFLSLVFLGIAISPAAGAAVAVGPPTAVVEKLNATLLAAMKGGKEMGFNGRFALLKPVIDEVFALQAITRISTGKQWAGFSPAQQKNLMALYSKWSAATYAKNFDGYDGEAFQISGSEVADQHADVSSGLVQKDGKRVQFLYKLIKNGGAWRIVDIHMEGVSQLSMTRVQFNSILERGGYEGLVKSLNEKIEELGSGS